MKKVIFITLLLFANTIICMFVLFYPSSLTVIDTDIQKHIVSPNETMWGIISKKYSSLINRGEDIREIIFLVEEYNKTSARLEVGQVVLLPTIQ